MALIPCPECKKRISDTAKKCPNCGFNLAKQKRKEKVEEISKQLKMPKNKHNTEIVVLVIMAIVGIIITVVLINKSTEWTRDNETSEIRSKQEKQKTDEEKDEPKEEREVYNGKVFALSELKNNKKQAVEYVDAMNKYISLDEYYKESAHLDFYKVTKERGFTFYQFKTKNDISFSLIFNNKTNNFHCITVIGDRYQDEYALNSSKVRQAAIRVTTYFDSCRYDSPNCALTLIGTVSSYKTNFDYYEVEYDKNSMIFTWMSTLD